MNYQIIIVTEKYFDIIHNAFRQRYDRQKYRGCKDLGELCLEGLTVRLRRTVDQVRGYKAHMIYADEHLRPMTIINSGNTVLPLTKSVLAYVFGVNCNELLDEANSFEIK